MHSMHRDAGTEMQRCCGAAVPCSAADGAPDEGCCAADVQWPPPTPPLLTRARRGGDAAETGASHDGARCVFVSGLDSRAAARGGAERITSAATSTRLGLGGASWRVDARAASPRRLSALSSSSIAPSLSSAPCIPPRSLRALSLPSPVCSAPPRSPVRAFPRPADSP